MSFTASDLHSLQTLIHDFFQLIDQGEASLFASERLFSATAFCTVIDQKAQTTKTFTGFTELHSLASFIHTKFPTAQHWEGNIVLTPLALSDSLSSSSSSSRILTAKNRSYWQAIQEGQIVSYGTHEDVFDRDENDRWRFQQRIIVKTWAK